MDKPITNVKGVCQKFVGKFDATDWETIMQLGKSMKKLRVKLINTTKNQGLVITSRNGVLNLYREKEGAGRVTGSLYLIGTSVSEIVEQPIWRVFETAAHSFQSDAVINFFPSEGIAIEYKNGQFSEKVLFEHADIGRDIDNLLRQIQTDHLLEKLNIAVKADDRQQISWLKQELQWLITNR